MSDQGDFRGSREEKRKEETVMLGKDEVANLMAAAKAGVDPVPAAEPTITEPSVTAPSAAESGSNNTMLIVGAAVGVVVLLLIIYLATKG